MSGDTHKKAGRPRVDPGKKATKPNISIRRDLLDELEAAAKKRGIGRSEYVTMALSKQLARDEMNAEHLGNLQEVQSLDAPEEIKKRSGT